MEASHARALGARLYRRFVINVLIEENGIISTRAMCAELCRSRTGCIHRRVDAEGMLGQDGEGCVWVKVSQGHSVASFSKLKSNYNKNLNPRGIENDLCLSEINVGAHLALHFEVFLVEKV